MVHGVSDVLCTGWSDLCSFFIQELNIYVHLQKIDEIASGAQSPMNGRLQNIRE